MNSLRNLIIIVSLYIENQRGEVELDKLAWNQEGISFCFSPTSRKPVRCTGKLLKIKFKLVLIPFTSFVKRQGLATNQFVARLLQPTTWQLIRLSRCII